MPLVEDRVMHHLVQKHREVEDGEALNEGERNLDQWILEVDERPGGERKKTELPGRDDEVARRRLPVKLAHQVTRDRSAQLSA